MHSDNMTTIIDLVTQANPERSTANLRRRLHKLLEELGELSEAYLSVTDTTISTKNKTWLDVREEAVDVLIVAIDIAVTDAAIQPLPIGDVDYDGIIWQMAYHLGTMGEFLHDEHVYRSSANMLACYGFTLVDLFFDGDPDGVLAEVQRKLAKWLASKSGGRPVAVL
jgi:hypothetical protein